MELADARDRGQSIRSTEDDGTRSYRGLEGDMTCFVLIWFKDWRMCGFYIDRQVIA